MAKKSNVVYLDKKSDDRYISDIQRAYLSYVTDWLKVEKFGRKLGYKALGERLNPKAPLNQTTMMRWHRCQDDIGKPEGAKKEVKTLPQEASLEIALHNLPKSGESEEETEELYGATIEEHDSSRQAGYSLPITQEMFALVFGLEAENSANLNTQVKALAEKISVLGQWKEETTTAIKEIQTQLAQLTSAISGLNKDEASKKRASVDDGTKENLNDTVLTQVLTAISELTHSVETIKKQVSGIASTDISTEDTTVPHPLDGIRKAIQQENLDLAEVSAIAGANIETLKKLLNGELDDIICDQDLPRIKRMAALHTLSQVVIVINELVGSNFNSNTILEEYSEIKCPSQA